MELNRRDFLKGALVTGAVAASGAALAGCSGGQPTQQGSTDAGSASSNEVLTAENYQNQKWSFEVAPEPVAESDIAETFTHDIVIVGAGMAGLCTAVAAAEKGADVIVFSASTKPISRGGSNHAIGSKIQKEFNIDYTPETAAHIVKMEQTSGSYYMDKKKWEKWINHSAESIDWTIDHMEARGLHCCLEPGYTDPSGVLTVPPASHNFWNEEQPFGALFGAPLEAQAYADIFTEDFGGEIHYKTIGQYLIRDDNNTGRVSAVVAQREDGSYVKYVANKAVVLATGDFSQDKDMVAKYCPMALPFGYGGVYDGSGLKLALWIGASWQKYTPNAPMLATMGDEVLPCRWWAEGALTTFPGLLVNKKGVRYSNENCTYGYMPYPQRVQPDGCAFLIWDENWVQDSAPWQSDRVGGEPRDTQEVYDAIQALFDPNTDWTTTDEYAGFDATMAENAVKADTLEELADGLGLPREEFLAQVERYNSYCETGLDDEFHKDKRFLLPVKQPPFYGIKNEPYTLCITGGLNTDIQMHVCDNQNDPIPGLYGVGTVVGDMYGDVYDYKVPGINLGGACTTFGYLLGKNLSAGKW